MVMAASSQRAEALATLADAQVQANIARQLVASLQDIWFQQAGFGYSPRLLLAQQFLRQAEAAERAAEIAVEQLYAMQQFTSSLDDEMRALSFNFYPTAQYTTTQPQSDEQFEDGDDISNNESSSYVDLESDGSSHDDNEQLSDQVSLDAASNCHSGNDDGDDHDDTRSDSIQDGEEEEEHISEEDRYDCDDSEGDRFDRDDSEEDEYVRDDSEGDEYDRDDSDEDGYERSQAPQATSQSFAVPHQRITRSSTTSQLSVERQRPEVLPPDNDEILDAIKDLLRARNCVSESEVADHLNRTFPWYRLHPMPSSEARQLVLNNLYFKKVGTKTVNFTSTGCNATIFYTFYLF